MLTNDIKIIELYTQWKELKDNKKNIPEIELVAKTKELIDQINQCLDQKEEDYKKEEVLLEKLRIILDS